MFHSSKLSLLQSHPGVSNLPKHASFRSVGGNLRIQTISQVLWQALQLPNSNPDTTTTAKNTTNSNANVSLKQDLIAKIQFLIVCGIFIIFFCVNDLLICAWKWNVPQRRETKNKSMKHLFEYKYLSLSRGPRWGLMGLLTLFQVLRLWKGHEYKLCGLMSGC